MKIEWGKKANEFQEHTYYDMNGVEIRKGDTVLMDGREWEVLLCDIGCLGVDATNPMWVRTGRACAGEYGVYPFEESDKPIVVKK